MNKSEPDMNEPWSTMNISTLTPRKLPEEVSLSDLNSLLKGRKYGIGQENNSINMCPPVSKYDSEEMLELEDYCKKRGIVGVNFNGMSPRAVLHMLKSKSGDRSTITEVKKEILYG